MTKYYVSRSDGSHSKEVTKEVQALCRAYGRGDRTDVPFADLCHALGVKSYHVITTGKDAPLTV